MIGRRPFAVLWALAVLAGACTSGGGDMAGSTATTGEAAPTSTTRPLPVAGGVLRLGVGRIESLDPATASPESASTAIALDLLYDGLTELRAGDEVARPALAASWTPSEGATVWRFSLRQGARFSDGSPITAADVERSIERVLQRGNASLVGSRLAAVNGYDAFVSGAAPDLPGIVAVDPATVEIRLDRPLSTVPEVLAAPAFGIVAPGEDVEAPAATSGPFRLERRDGDVLHLVRVSGSDAYLEGVELHQYDDLAAAYDAFAEDELDWTIVPSTRVDLAAERYGVEGFGPFHTTMFFGFNLADPTFADVRFRQAIVQAVDREAIVNAVYFGVAEPLATIVPAGVPGHSPARCAAGCQHDPDAARALLAEAFGGGPVPEVVVDYDETADHTAVAGIIEQNLEAVGIPVTLRPHAPEEFGTFIQQGQGALIRLGWLATATTAAAYLAPLFHSGSVDNVTGLSDPTVDQLLDGAARATTAPERFRLLGQAEEAILALAPTLNLLQSRILTVAADHVHDLELGLDGTFDPLTVWLDR